MSEDTSYTDVMSKKLGTPFPESAIKTRQGQAGRSFRYVEGHTVIHRLNEATGNNWSLDIKEITSIQVGNESRLQARVALTIPGLGTREHIGVQSVNDRGGEDLVKGVVTDALKKAATLFGVGLELYGPDYEAGEIAQPQRGNASVRPQEPRRDAQRPNPSGHATRIEQAATPRQIQFISAIARELGISEEELRAESSSRFTRDVSGLNRRDASIFIEDLQQRRANRPANPHPTRSNAPSGAPDPIEPPDDNDSDNDSGQQAMIDDFNTHYPPGDLAAKHRQ